jgi:ADP-ribosylglycohydrolase
MHYQFIRELHNGRVTDLLPYNRPPDFHPAGSGAYARTADPGAYTDDTRLSQLIVKSIIDKKGRISADDLGRTWMAHMDTDFFWHSIKNSYFRIAIGRTPVREAGSGNIPDNSSAMCIGPIGVINAGNPEQAALDAYEIASLSHDSYSREAASVIAAAVAEAMNPQATVNSIVDAALCYIPNKETSAIVKAMNLALELAEKAADTEEMTALFYDQLIVRWIRRHTQGPNAGPDNMRHSPSVDALESVPCALAMFYKTKGVYVDSVVAAANFGRDCDTIACMTGYISGAMNGLDAIPAAWVEASCKANPEPDQMQLVEGLTLALLNEKHKADAFSAMIEGLNS